MRSCVYVRRCPHMRIHEAYVHKYTVARRYCMGCIGLLLQLKEQHTERLVAEVYASGDLTSLLELRTTRMPQRTMHFLVQVRAIIELINTIWTPAYSQVWDKGQGALIKCLYVWLRLYNSLLVRLCVYIHGWYHRVQCAWVSVRQGVYMRVRLCVCLSVHACSWVCANVC